MNSTGNVGWDEAITEALDRRCRAMPVAPQISIPSSVECEVIGRDVEASEMIQGDLVPNQIYALAGVERTFSRTRGNSRPVKLGDTVLTGVAADMVLGVIFPVDQACGKRAQFYNPEKSLSCQLVPFDKHVVD